MPWDEVMHKWKAGTLHSGSPGGPAVRSQRQAVAIMLSEKRAAEGGKKEYQSMSKPKGARGRAAVARLGRTQKTGGFQKIASKAGKEYGSTEAGRRVAASVYWKMVHNRGG